MSLDITQPGIAAIMAATQSQIVAPTLNTSQTSNQISIDVAANTLIAQHFSAADRWKKNRVPVSCLIKLMGWNGTDAYPLSSVDISDLQWALNVLQTVQTFRDACDALKADPTKTGTDVVWTGTQTVTMPAFWQSWPASWMVSLTDRTAWNTAVSQVTAILSGANSGVDTFIEAYNRFVTDESAASALNSALATETTNRTTGDATNAAAISSESTARASADTAEASTRAAADSTLTVAIAAKYTLPAGTTLQYLRGDGTLATFPTIPAAQVNSDWNASSGLSQILNKPTLGTAAATAATAYDAAGAAATAQAFAIQRSNHTGTQLAATISDFAAQVVTEVEAATFATTLPRYRRFWALVTGINVGTTGDKSIFSNLSNSYQVIGYTIFNTSGTLSSLAKMDIRTAANGAGTLVATALLTTLTTISAPLAGTISTGVLQSAPLLYLRVSVANATSQTVSVLVEILDFSTP
jgi:hypothetical protein